MPSLRASQHGLKIVDCARKKRNWNKTAKAWWQPANSTEATLKRFWRRIPIQRDTFIDICNVVEVNWEDVVDHTPVRSAWIEFSVYDDGWVGRKKLIQEFSELILSSTRILLILGITGIGKTALAEKLVEEVRGDWSEIRENCENEAKSFEFANIALQWLEKWGDKVPQEERNPENLLPRLVQRLSQNRYLILLDSLEYILTGNEVDGWGDFIDPWWGKFFVGILAEPNFQSRVILTSQDFPVQIEKECSRYDNLWHEQPIKGLNVDEQIALFSKAKLDTDIKLPQNPLRLIGEIYDGHPLALRIIAGEIKKTWYGNVAKYWRDNSQYILEVKEALEAARNQNQSHGEEDRWQLDSYTTTLRRRVRQRVETTFARLRKNVPDAYRLLCIASIYRCEIKEQGWLIHLALEGYSFDKQKAAMQSLKDRYLVEEYGIDHEGDFLVGQHNLIRSVAISHRLQLFGENKVEINNTSQ